MKIKVNTEYKENDIIIVNTEGKRINTIEGVSQAVPGGKPLTIGRIKANTKDPGKLIKSSIGLVLRVDLKAGHILIVPNKVDLSKGEDILAKRIGAKI